MKMPRKQELAVTDFVGALNPEARVSAPVGTSNRTAVREVAGSVRAENLKQQIVRKDTLSRERRRRTVKSE